MNYKRSLEDEEKLCKEAFSSDLPSARIETIRENIETHNLKPEQLKEYCEKLFHFKTIKVMRFKSWSERRQYSKKRRQEKQIQRPTLPDGLFNFLLVNESPQDNTVCVSGTNLITFPIQVNESDTNNQNSKKEWIMNPNGKSYICILHEYVQHALKKQPTYKFTELGKSRF